LGVRSRDEALSLEQRMVPFIRAAWPVVVADKPYVHGYHIDAMAEHLEAALRFEIRTLIINVPPGFAKSTVCSVMWPAFAWARNPSLAFMFTSYHEKLSTRDSVSTRDLIKSAWYQSLWGHRVRLKDDQNEKKRFQTDKGGLRQASTVGGYITGEHVDFLGIDDPHNATDVGSPVAMRETHQWWDLATPGRGRDPSRYVRMIVAQRLSDLDLCAHVLANEPGVCHLKIPMKYKPAASYVSSIGWKDWRTKEDELAWPEFFPLPVVEAQQLSLRATGTAAQHQQDPIVEGGVMFKSEQFRYFEWVVEGLDQKDEAEIKKLKGGGQFSIPGVFVLHGPDGKKKRFYGAECTAAQYIDTAMKTGVENDFTVCLTGVRTPEGDMLVLDVVRAQILIPRQFGWIMAQRQRFPWLSYQCVESKASGEGLLQQGDAEGYPIRELKAVGDKILRAQPGATACERGKVYFLSGASWLVGFEDELLHFPLGEYKDQVDAFAYFVLDTLSNQINKSQARSFTGPGASAARPWE